MDTSFVDIKDKTADMTFITGEKKTYEVNDIETTFEDASIKMDVSCEQLGDYLDELASVDVNVDDIETADGVTGQMMKLTQQRTRLILWLKTAMQITRQQILRKKMQMKQMMISLHHSTVLALKMTVSHMQHFRY